MDPENFIIAAYSITLVLLGMLVIATWRGAARTQTQLAQRDDS
ncbi:MAG: heme exporter protein CcmD [Rickettsiales bacterium]